MTNKRGMSESKHHRQLQRVRGLLAKAESTPYPDEAASLTAKAHELMIAHAISTAMVQEQTGEGQIVTARITIEAPYVKHKYRLLCSVARPNNCQAILGVESSYLKQLIDTGAISEMPEGSRIASVVGYQSDLEMVELLFTSLLLQAVNLMLAHGSVITEWGNETKSFRRAFLYGFANTVGERLNENTERAAAAASQPSGDSALPVLANRAERVQMATDDMFPSATPLRTSISNFSGLAAGQRAGHRADIGSTRLQRSGRALPQ